MIIVTILFTDVFNRKIPKIIRLLKWLNGIIKSLLIAKKEKVSLVHLHFFGIGVLSGLMYYYLNFLALLWLLQSTI